MDAMFRLQAMVAKTVANHPVGTAASGVVSAVIGFLQSSQQVASTLIALVTSVSGLLAAGLALRTAWRNRNKE